MTNRQMSFLSGALFVLLGASLMWGQVTTATILGRVQDQTGAVVPGVSVTARNVNTGLSRTVVSNEQGRYQVLSLPPGNYEVQGEMAGFQKAIRRGIELTVGREAVVNLALAVGEVTEQVVVIGEAPLVETTRAEMAGLVGQQQIQDLPLNGRSLDQLVYLEPGIVPMKTQSGSINVGFAGHIQSGGARMDANVFLLDGTDANDFVGATPGSVSGNFLGADTVREFKVLRHNYSAEFGRAAGSVISQVSRSGTNSLHGNLFAFHRNDNMDARNFFDPLKGPPEFKRNQFGGSAGGPIIRDRTFFFGSAEILRERLGLSVISFWPNAAARAGFLPNPRTGELEPVGIDPQVRPFLNVLPLPNGRDFGDGTGEFLSAFSQPTDEEFYMGRIDHRFSDAHAIFGRYTLHNSILTRARPHPSFAEGQMYRGQYVTLEDTYTFSPSMINVLRFGFTRTSPALFSQEEQAFDPSLLFLDGVNHMGTILFTGRSGAGTGALSEFGPYFNISFKDQPQTNIQNMFQVSDSVSYVTGRHLLKFGFNFQRFQHNVFGNVQWYGNWRFGSIRDFLGNKPLRFEAHTPESDPDRGWRQNLVGVFAQDDMQLARNLTMNLGVRWEFTTVPSEVHGEIANLIDVNKDTGKTLGVLWDSNLRNVAPRFGLSWDVTGDGRTAVRLGLGMFHNMGIGRSWERFARQAGPGLTLAQIEGAALDFSFPRAPARALQNVPSTSNRFTHLDLEGMVPTMLHWNFTLAQELMTGTVVEAAYVGSHGYHLRRLREGNDSLPTQVDGRPFMPVVRQRRNRALGQTDYFTQDSISNYNSLQVSVRRRFQSGFQFQGSYTLAKSVDDNSAVASGESRAGGSNKTQIPDDRTADRGRSNFDIRQRAVFNFIYELPSPGQGIARHLFGGWRTSNIITFSDGYPLNMLLPFARSRSFALSDRPDLAPGRSNDPVLGGPDQYFDPTAFVLQPAGFFGNVGRNTVTGPGLATWDFSLGKVLPLPLNEVSQIEFKAEFFNVLNHANFSFPALNIFNSDGSRNGQAGRITETGTTSRQIQLGLRFTF